MAGALIGSSYCDEVPVLPRTETRYDAHVQRLREAAHPHRDAPQGFAAYLDKVRRNAYEVTDEDVQALKDAGYSEDVIFEQTVSVAVAAGLERLDAALRVVP
jgi:alkylhydroperoxidase family enzyme